MFVSLQHWHSTWFHNTISLKLVVGTYGWSQCTMKKTSYKFPSDFPFIAYLLNLNYEKSAKCNPFQREKFFSIFPKYWQVSKYTAMLSKFSFPKKGNKNKSNFRMANLCNGGTKDFVELWEIIHLKIWTHFSIRQTKLFWINLKHYSQTCSNYHLCRTTIGLKQPMLSADLAQANFCTVVTV